MTKAEYAKYEQAVKRGLDGLQFVSTGSCPGCEECGLGDEPTEHERETADEPSFSWAPCDCCGSSLGGDRHPAHARTKDNMLIHLSVCTDCLYYINYGQLDDMTMLDMERE